MPLPQQQPARSVDARVVRYAEASTALALVSDGQLGQLLDEAPIMGSGFGGSSAVLRIGGVPVFSKRVPLTDLERQPENVMSTANLFQLPTFYQYGVGSAGLGVWRELAANIMTTNWVLSWQTEAFPLLYHWRVLPGTGPAIGAQADIEHTVAFWAGSPAVRNRLDSLARASASVVLFFEHIPQNLADWLAGQVLAGAEAIAVAGAMVERCLRRDIAFMNADGLLHFDLHFHNVLTDGHRLYAADLGLAMSPRFDLSEVESAFATRNLSHDRCYALTRLVNWLVSQVCTDADLPGRDVYLRRCAAGAEPTGVPAPIAEIISRYAPVAVVLNDFYRDLFGTSRTTPYPAEEMSRAIALVPDWP